MVALALQEAIASLDREQRLELRDYLDSTMDSTDVTLTAEDEQLIRDRAAELDADPAAAVDSRAAIADLRSLHEARRKLAA
ncbi:MAG: hypothetical protein LBR20_00445 [Propionibacteriaceae bacterium]|jgi:hypothetical protein|nr:hypothetical protein [Propionibacteriaceae bacterium]